MRLLLPRRAGSAARVLSSVTLALTVLASSAAAQRPLGVDVSQFQGNIDWSQVYASGRVFAFVRASHGSLQDTTFLNNMPAARAAGVYAGAYHFAVPVYDSNYNLAGADPQTEAVRFLSRAQTFISPGYLRPVLDVELGDRQTPVGAANLSAWANAWINYVQQQTGVEAMVYCSSNYARNYLNSTMSSRTLWLADWEYPSDPNTAQPTHGTGVWSGWVFWQYSNMGNTAGHPSVAGIPARVDLNVFNGTLTQLQTYVIGTPAVITRTPATLTRTIRQGLSPASQSFTIRNTGTGLMVYNIGVTGDWLTVTPENGTSTGEIDTITVNYATTALAPGAYNGTISMACPLASNSPQTIPVALTVQPIPGNLDADSDVDALDVAIFSGCLTGANQGPPAGGCTGADLDNDGDVDQTDFAIMQTCFSGTGIPADPACTP